MDKILNDWILHHAISGVMRVLINVMDIIHGHNIINNLKGILRVVLN
jgi:hypothetical protein